MVIGQIQLASTKKLNIPGMLEWEVPTRHALARARRAALVAAGQPQADYGSGPNLKFWTPVNHSSSSSRGRGYPMPHWEYRDGEIRHTPGNRKDYLYLRMPLEGDFELNCELTSFGWREMQALYAGRALMPVSESKVNIYRFIHMAQAEAINPPLPKIEDWYPLRIVRKQDEVSFLIHDREIYKKTIETGSDPWLALGCHHTLTSGARKVTITGQPTIPEVLELRPTPELDGWIPDHFEQSAGLGKSDWYREDDEIRGRKRTIGPVGHYESFLYYHRPLIEDSQVEYEFYYEPGQSLVHPAVGRVALLLDSKGVNVHWLTDGKHERNGLSADNTTTEPGNRRGADLPLKSGDWNQAKLITRGDRASLWLNGQLIYERELEAGMQRFFGLFHYADHTEARIRNIRYRGNWPRELPKSENLFQLLEAK
jgi:hypothetical protein